MNGSSVARPLKEGATNTLLGIRPQSKRLLSSVESLLLAETTTVK